MSKNDNLSVFHRHALDTLKSTWSEILNIDNLAAARDPSWSDIIHDLLFKSGNTYPYILVTQLLGKSTDESLNANCLQESSTLHNAWDARSLASKVVSEWNKEIGKALPGTNQDPYVNNPARYKNFGTEMKSKAKNLKGYENLEKIVDYIENTGKDSALHLLKVTLVEIRSHLETNKREYFGPPKVSLEDVTSVLNIFLSEKSNGVRLQIVTYSIFKTFSDSFPGYGDIRSYATNSSDASSGRAGDIERWNNGKVDFAIEVKDRTITIFDLESSILKCRTANIRNLLFVAQATPLLADENEILKRIRHEFTRGMDVNYIDSKNLFNTGLMLLSPEQRADLLKNIHEALEELGAHLSNRNRWMDLMKTI